MPYQPQYPQQIGIRSRTNGLAGVSLGFGIGQFLLPIFGALIAIVCGHIARGQIRRTGEQGDGLAIAGLVLGYLGILIPAADHLAGRGSRTAADARPTIRMALSGNVVRKRCQEMSAA